MADSAVAQEGMAKENLQLHIPFSTTEEDHIIQTASFWPQKLPRPSSHNQCLYHQLKNLILAGLNWREKVAGNPANGERLLSSPFKTDTFLPYTRPVV